MNGFSRQLARVLACAVLLIPAVTAHSATLVAGAGANPPTPASGSTPVTVPPSNGTCPQGYELKRSVVNGIKKLTCVLISFVPSSPDTEQWFASLGKYLLPYAQRTATWIDRLSPVSAAEARLLALRFDSALFLQPIKFTYESAEASATATSGWRFEGPGLLIVWIEDVVGG